LGYISPGHSPAMALKISMITLFSLGFFIAHGSVQSKHMFLHTSQNNDIEKPVDTVQGPLTAVMPQMSAVVFLENRAKRMKSVLSALARKVHLKKSVASPEEEKVESEDLMMGWVYWHSSMVIYFILFLLVAVIYKNNNWGMQELDEKTLENLEADSDFKSCIACHEEPYQCCCALFCGGIRWADAQSAAGMYGYWMAIAIWLAVAVLDSFTHWMMWVFISVLFTFFRNKLRQKLKMKNEWSDTMYDCTLWCCCMCCAIFQEARHVEELSKANDKEKETAGEPGY